MEQCWYASPVGRLLLAGDARGLRGLWLEGQKYFAATLPPDTVTRDTPLLLQASRWLDAYFAGERPAPDALPLCPQGSPFRQAVWAYLCRIPYGQTVTYGQIAAGLGVRSAQAIGGAVGHNPLSILIPCHRVVGADGSLTGYAGGVEKKLWLLRHEGAALEGLFVPKRGSAL